jgi:Tol biopolymer transport system component
MSLPRILCASILVAVSAAPALAEVTFTPFTSGANQFGDDFPTWSPDGSRIVYQSRDLNPAYPSLYYEDLGEGTSEQLYSEVGAPTVNFMHPVFSPDGQWVVYARLDGTWYHLYRRPAAGGTEEPITSGTAGPPVSGYGDMCPTFSPDGEWIVFTSSRGSTDGGFVDLWRVKPDGTGLQRLTNDNSPFDYLWATWRPGSSTVVYSRQSELQRITVGAGISNPTALGYDGNHPSFSPDGNWLAYDRGADLYVSHYASGTETPITQSSAYEESPVWSPSGTQLAFSWFANGERAIWLAADVLTVPTKPSTWGRIKATYR